MERKGKKCRVNPYFCLDVTNSQGKRNRGVVNLKKINKYKFTITHLYF